MSTCRLAFHSLHLDAPATGVTPSAAVASRCPPVRAIHRGVVDIPLPMKFPDIKLACIPAGLVYLEGTRVRCAPTSVRLSWGLVLVLGVRHAHDRKEQEQDKRFINHYDE